MPFGPARKRIGERRHQAELQSSITVIDPMRGRTQTWSTYDTVMAAVDLTPTVVSETQATVSYVVTFPHHQDVEVDQRVLVNGMTLKVIAIVNPELRNRESLLYCAIAAEAN